MIRVGGFKIRTSCKHCGNPLILNGPQRYPRCPQCDETTHISAEVWRGLLTDLEEEWPTLAPGTGTRGISMTGGFTFHRKYGRVEPICGTCKAPLELDSVPVGNMGVVSCPEGHQSIDSFPTPKWLQEVLPTAVQLYGAEVDEGDNISKKSTPDGSHRPEGAQRPVVLQCPQCSGALKITEEMDRVIPCEYCDVDIYLPDAIWLRLHPVKVVRLWFVGFQGDYLETKRALEKKIAEREEGTS